MRNYTPGSFKSADISGNGQGTASSGHADVAARAAQSGATPSTGAARNTPTASPAGAVGTVIAVLVLLIALRFFAGKSSHSEEYAALAPTFYNVMVITLSAVLGLTLLKAVALKWLPSSFPLRGLVLSA